MHWTRWWLVTAADWYVVGWCGDMAISAAYARALGLKAVHVQSPHSTVIGCLR